LILNHHTRWHYGFELKNLIFNQRALCEFGQNAPVIAVSATESCDAERLPWDESLVLISRPGFIAQGS
jgi:hypothetical protein